jgi:hypothetical protein
MLMAANDHERTITIPADMDRELDEFARREGYSRDAAVEKHSGRVSRPITSIGHGGPQLRHRTRWTRRLRRPHRQEVVDLAPSGATAGGRHPRSRLGALGRTSRSGCVKIASGKWRRAGRVRPIAGVPAWPGFTASIRATTFGGVAGRAPFNVGYITFQLGPN